MHTRAPPSLARRSPFFSSSSPPHLSAPRSGNRSGRQRKGKLPRSLSQLAWNRNCLRPGQLNGARHREIHSPPSLSEGEILPSTVVNPQDKLKDSRATDFSFLPSIFSIFSPLLSQGSKVSIFSEGRKASFLFIFLSSKFEHLWGIFNERGGERNGEGNATSQRK